MKVIISFTTSPERIEKIEPMVNSILNQSIKPDLFLLNIPKIFKRTNERYTIPKFVKDNVTINIIHNDCGPATKIIPTINYLKNNNYNFNESRIIYLDDDIEYTSQMIEVFLNYSFDKHHILCSSGISIVQNTSGEYDFLPQRKHENDVKIVEGYGAVCLSPLIFKNDFEKYFLKYINNISAFTSDDLILSNYYQKDNNNRCVCINTNDFSVENMWNKNCILEYGNLKDALHKQHDDNIMRYRKVIKLLKTNKDLFIKIKRPDVRMIMNI